jgi:hypothetical protein
MTHTPTREAAITKAGAWFEARKRGERLPEHVLKGDAR